jgi:hypothetical protein
MFYFYVIILYPLRKVSGAVSNGVSAMVPIHLDVSRLPQQAFVGLTNVASVIMTLRGAVDELARVGLVRQTQSFGFAAATPSSDPLMEWEWDNPYQFTWFVAGWGPERDRFIANAVRKLRACLRTDMDTLTLRIKKPFDFQDVVDSVDEYGNFPWGDYAWGGATFVRAGHFVIPCAVSCLAEVEDDAVAKLMGGLLGNSLLRGTNPAEFGPNP